MEDGLLKRKVVDGSQEFWSIYLPASLVLQVFQAANDDLGHNGFPKTYEAVKNTKHINHGLEWDELTPMATACYNYFPNCNARESAFFLMSGRDPVNKINHILHQARRYFHDENSLPDLEALKNIYQVVAQQFPNSRERYMKKHHNQKPVEYPVKPGDLVLMVKHAAKAFEPKYKKETYRVVKVNGNQVDIRHYGGNISMVHITDMKKTTLTDEVADDCLQLCNEGRFTKKCVPRGYIPNLDWTTINDDQNQPIKPVKQEEDPTETIVTQLHLQRLRDHQVVVLDPKLSSNQTGTTGMKSSIVGSNGTQSSQHGG